MKDFLLGLDSYAFENLAVHLSRAGKLGDLYKLLLEPGWKVGSFDYDPSTRRYSQDIETAWHAIAQQIKKGNSLDEKPILAEPLSWLAPLTWLSARLKQNASHLYPNLIEAITLVHGQEKAYQYTLNIPDMIRQAECRLGIARGLLHEGQPDAAIDTLKDTFAFLGNLPADLFNENLVRQGEIVVALAQFGAAELTNAYHDRFQMMLANEAERAGGITNTARFARIKAYIAVGMLDEAVEVIQIIPDEKDREDTWLNALAFQVNILGSFSLLARLHAVMGKSFLEKTENRDVRATIWAGLGEYEKASELLGNMAEPSSKLKITQAFMSYLYRSSLKNEFSEMRQQAVKLIESMPPSAERLKLFLSFILGLYRNRVEMDASVWLALVQEDVDAFSTALDANSLSEVALSLSIMDDLGRAKGVIERTVQHDQEGMNFYDWDKVSVDILFSSFFAGVQDTERLRELFSEIASHAELWEKTEALVAFAKRLEPGWGNTLLAQTHSVLDEIQRDRQAISQRPNTAGPLIVWLTHQGAEMVQTEELLSLALKSLEEDGDQEDALSYLALTFAKAGLSTLGQGIASRALDALKTEEDENTIARASGTVMEAAVSLGDEEILASLLAIAEGISDEWLKAESLFWIAGGYALLEQYEQAREIFWRAVEVGAWQEVAKQEILDSWNNEAAALDFLTLVEYIGWPSTSVAVVVSWLAVLVKIRSNWMITVGLQMINLIPAAYSEKRSFCLHLLVNATELEEDFLQLYLESLDQGRQEHTGEVWAVLAASLSRLGDRYGAEFIQETWDSLRQAQALFS